MRVLLVEDDAYKRQRIEAVLVAAKGFTKVGSVAVATNVFEAVREMKEGRPDILILDIALPLTEDGDPQEHAGIELLEDVMRHPKEYGPPSHTIGITAYRDVYERCSRQFASWLLSIVLYSPESSEWEDSLRARVEHILYSSASTATYGCDLCIVCALESPELTAVRALPFKWERTARPGDHTIYYEGTFAGAAGERKVVAAAAARKGMPAATTVATKMIQSFRPRYISMVGIAAGIRDRMKYGDIIVANPCWDWGSGKWTRGPDDGSGRFLAAPFQAHLDVGLREQLQGVAADRGALDEIRREWTGESPEHVLSARVGPLASGASVLADEDMMAQIAEQQREIIGVEMEGYGVFVAAEESAEPRPKAMVIKSVVDFGGIDKDDKFQAYGAYTAAAFLGVFVRRHL